MNSAKESKVAIPHILVVDDDPIMLTAAVRLLKNAGYAVSQAASGAEALQQAREIHPDLILLDVVLPDTSGFEVCQQIKADVTLREISVILLSGVPTGSEVQAEGLEFGADDYITKPVSNRELLARVKTVLRIKQAEAEIKASEEKYYNLFTYANDSIFIVHPETLQVLDANENAALRLGYERDELLKLSLHELDAPQNPSQIKAIFQELREKGSVAFEQSHRRKDGTEIPVEITSRLIEYGEAQVIQSFVRDISERKSAEKQLKKMHADLERTLELTPDMICTASPEGHFLSINPAFTKVLGYSETELLATPYTDLIHPEDLAATLTEVERQLAGNSTIHFQNRYRHRDGSYKVLEWETTPAENGILYAAARDVTERVRAEAALRTSQALLQEAQQVAHIGHWELIPEIGIPTWSEEIFHIFGLDPIKSEPSFAAHQNLVHPEDWEILNQAVTQANTDGTPFDIEFRLLRPKGEVRWMGAKGTATRDQDGKVLRLFGTAQDITDRKKAEKIRFESEVRFRNLFETMAQGVVYQSSDGTVIDANPAAERILGLSLDQLQGRTSLDPEWRAIHPDGSDFSGDSHPAMLALKTGKPVHNAVMGVFNPETGSYRWININAIPHFKSEGSLPDQVFATFDDITARIRSENELRELHTQIQLHAAHLERRVAERTQELENRVKQVDQMNRAMTNLFSDLEVNKKTLENSQAELQNAHELLKQERVEEQAALLRLSQILLAENDSKTIMDVVVKEVTKALDSNLTSLVLVADDGVHYSAQAWEGWPDDISAGIQNMPIHKNSAMGRVIFTNSPVVSADIDQDEFFEPEFIRQMGIKSRLIVPIVMSGRVIGGLAVNERDNRQWSEDEIRLLNLFANTTAQALDRARLFETERQQRLVAEMLREAADLVVSTLDLNQVLVNILEVLKTAVGYKCAAVFLESDDCGDSKDERCLRLITGKGFPDLQEIQSQVYPLQDSFFKIITETANPLVLRDVQEEPGFEGWGETLWPHGWLGVPLIYDHKVIGIITLDGEDVGIYGERESILAQAFANQTSAAIVNAQLFAQVSNSRQRLQALSNQLAEAQESERRNLSRELHDQIGQTLTAIKINITALEYLPDAEKRDLYIKRCLAATDQAIQKVRNLSLDLRPSALDDLGLPAAIRWFLRNQEETTGLSYHLEVADSEDRLPSQLATICYRVLQEACTNILRHAKATRVKVRVWREDQDIFMNILDDGVGFDLNQALDYAKQGRSLGLINMQERVELVGGRLVFRTQIGQGTEIQVRLPLDSDPSAAP